MSLDLNALEKLARAATPGPWYVVQEAVGRADLSSAPDKWGDITWGPEGDRSLALVDASYIAAVSPDVVLALIERLRALEGALNQSAHVIAFDENGWSLEHLVECRPHMTKCGYHRAAMQAAQDWNEQSFDTGRYAVSLTPEGQLAVGGQLRGGGT